mgnify:FL=1
MLFRSAKQIILSQLKQSDQPLTTTELTAAIQEVVTERTVRRWLKGWVEEGAITQIGKQRTTRYRWIEKSGETRHPLECFKFLQAVPEHRREALISQLRDLWTHTSTAIEGNTLSLGDTFNVLELGLTISGKPLREHNEIIGHAHAIEQIYALVNSDRPIVEEDLYHLHRSVQTELIADIYKPIGGWKVEFNGCNAVDANDQPTYIEYAHPLHIEPLMRQFIEELNRQMSGSISKEEAVKLYAKLHIGFVHIHPFWDGNGRMARLLANLPILKAGLPPLVIDERVRAEYIKSLATYQIAAGQLTSESEIWLHYPEMAGSFIEICHHCYRDTFSLIEKAEG